MTMPQILMLTHASWVNGKRMGVKAEPEDLSEVDPAKVGDPVVFKGKRLSELTTDEFMDYMGN